MTIKEVFQLIYTDLIRYADENKWPFTFIKKISILLLPCIMTLIIHRFTFYFYKNGHRIIARLLWTINYVFFSVDIVPFTDIGSHCYFPHPVGCVIMGKIGSYSTIFAGVTFGAGRGNDDIGGGIGAPVFGNNVILGARSTILGSIKIGNNVKIGANSLVLSDVPDNSVTYGNPCHIVENI